MTDMLTTELISFDGEVSPYSCAKMVNEYFKAMELEKILPPQMFYTYVKKNYIKSNEGKVNSIQLNEWLEKYLAKNA